jgi:hypothetical protein
MPIDHLLIFFKYAPLYPDGSNDIDMRNYHSYAIVNFVGAHHKGPHRAGRWLGIGMRWRDELKLVVWALNGGAIFREVEGEEFGDYEEIERETPRILRELVQRWQVSGPDLKKFHRDNPTTWAAVERYREQNPPKVWYSGGSGGASLIESPNPGNTPSQEAVRFFLMLILNPEWERLAGPCARCGKYYIRGTALNKLYCSRSCGTRATALAATKRKREVERAEKLHTVAKLCQQWSTTRTKKDWKSWICEREYVTKTFLTRAVNKGELEVPTKARK